MKIITLKKKNILKFTMLTMFIFVICGITNTFGMQHYYKLDFSTGLVTASTLNVRSGPGTQYKIIATVPKNQYIRIFAGIGEWYVVQVEGNHVGAVHKNYVKPIYANSSSTESSNTGSTGNTTGSNQTTTLSADEQEVFKLINQQRTNNGLKALTIDYEVQRVAEIKAQEMVDRNYFSHTSPTYGSPFNMLNSFKVSYKTAGENLAGNSNNNAAVNAWMNSSGHKANILNSSFTHTGIGIVNSSKYGKIYVQMFIGK